MFQTEHDLFHRHALLEESARGVEQDQASQQPQDQMPVVGVFALNLARLSGQQMFERPEVVFNPAPPLPGPDQTGRREGRGLTEQIGARLTRCSDDDDGD